MAGAKGGSSDFATVLAVTLLLPQPVVAAPLERPNADQEYVHVVRAGETLASIAASYGISVQDLRVSNNLVNRAELVSCAPNADSTQARGTVRLNGQPANGFRVVFSWRPDGQLVARAISDDGGQEGGQFSRILLASGPREGNWWFWVENDAGTRISEMAFVHTDRLPHEGMCQRAVLDFDIRSLDFTFIGRRLHIPVSSPPVVTASLKPPSAQKIYGHIVRHGETLASIATSYDISVQDLRASNSLSNRAELVHCDHNGINTQVRGTVRRNGQAVNGYRVAFSWQPDGRWWPGEPPEREACTPTYFTEPVPGKGTGGSGLKTKTSSAFRKWGSSTQTRTPIRTNANGR